MSVRMAGPRTSTVLVTGGCGLLGRTLVSQLVEEGVRVTLFDCAPRLPPQLAALSGVELVQGDITDYASILAAACRANHAAVFHLASCIDIHPVASEHVAQINVGGTENVIQACREASIPILIYTSSVDVVFGGEPAQGLSEDTASEPSQHLIEYGRTKAAAERLVLAASGPGLRTCALRPTHIYGGSMYSRANLNRVVSRPDGHRAPHPSEVLDTRG